jgi:hypothetical protein
MSIELALLRHVETLVQKRITRLERRVSYLHLSPALLKDIGLEGKKCRSPTSVSGSFKPVSGSESNNLRRGARPPTCGWQAWACHFSFLMSIVSI